MKVQDLVTLVPWTFVAQILNLFLQAFLIKKFLFKPINEVLQKRQEAADAQIREAQEAKNSADAIKSEYEQNMAKAREQPRRRPMTRAMRSLPKPTPKPGTFVPRHRPILNRRGRTRSAR